MVKKFKTRRTLVQTFLNFLPCFSSFGNQMSALNCIRDLEADFFQLEIKNGRFPRLILSLHEQLAFNGLNNIFSPCSESQNCNGTRAQLLLGFRTQ
ncbi:uncharacterized protein CEXT_120331 [Caerostris extrusa]|uniref:Uncharacterized protein n=1 Tax=Caerostris extrusa TaxID=172846 RepID=A0AAV4QBY3_CAEEX|nr:uncharacterized protein CEXT_120331 [Caerostris extrusa]